MQSERFKRWLWRATGVVAGIGVAIGVAVLAARQAGSGAPIVAPSPAIAGIASKPLPATETPHPASPDKPTRPPPAAEDSEDAQFELSATGGHATRRRIDPAAGQSVGTPQTGHLNGGDDLAAKPWPGLRILLLTQRRGFTAGTSEIVALLRDVATAVATAHPGSELAIGNVSRPGGGDIAQSVSHNSGRDADIAFFATDAAGRPVKIRHMHHFNDKGVASGGAGKPLHFDVGRNWAVVRHLLSHPAVVVQWLFVSAPLRNMMLDHALRIGEGELLRARARRVLVQPSDSASHDDHLHVRIACPPEDRPACIDGAGRTKIARDAQIDALLQMYRHGSPAEQRYARDMLSLPVDGADLALPPLETR